MDKMLKPGRGYHQANWKNNIEDDLKRLLNKKGVIGAFLISKNGETVTQAFQDASRHKENTLMQFVKKIAPVMLSMRNVPLRRMIFETKEGSIIFYSTDIGMVGCLLDSDYDLISVMLEIRMVGDLICSHLNNCELGSDKRDTILRENRDEFRVFNAELLGEIEKHFGIKLTEDLIQRTVR